MALFEIDQAAIRQKLASMPAQEALIILNDSISDINNHLSSLKILWNDLIPIARLPTDILRIILIAAAKQDARNAPPRLNWEWSICVELTSVCRTWRQVALETAAFWAVVPLTPYYANLSAMLPRWKSHPRQLQLRLPSAYNPPFNNHHLRHSAGLFADVHLLQEIRISPWDGPDVHTAMGNYDNFWTDLSSQSKMPGLHSLRCTFGNIYPAPMTPAFTYLVAAGATSLRELELASCQIEWQIIRPLLIPGPTNVNFRNLSSLHLVGIDVPADVMNDLLSQAQALRELVIDDSLPADFTPSFRLSSALETCTLSGAAQCCATVLSWVASLLATSKDIQRFRVQTTDIELPPSTLYPLLSGMVQSFLHISASVETGMALLVDDFETDVTLDRTTLRGSPQTQNSLQFSLQFRCEAIIQPLIWLDDSFHFPNIQSFSLYTRSPHCMHLELRHWQLFFERHPRIRSLHIRGTATQWASLHSLFYALASPLEDTDNSNTYSLPMLQSLSFTDVLFYRFGKERVSLDQLGAALEARYRVGLPIASVRFDECGRSANDVQIGMLTGKVPSDALQVTWDGIVKYGNQEE